MFGSGIISSQGECSNVLGGRCEVRPFDLETVLNTTVKVDEIHKVLFVIEGFDQMYEALLEAESQFFGGSRHAG
jgi:phenylalanine-4-hydroxylase